MCGRYTLSDGQDNTEIHEIIAAVNRRYPDQPIRTGEIFPTNTAPVLIQNGTVTEPVLLVWGFPKYQGSGVIINARAETAEEKKTFRDSLYRRRCMIPSTGFYEWGADKRKYLFRLPGEQTLYMAGIYREYEGIRRYVILTTAANASMKSIHDRMPVILPRDEMQMWMCDIDEALRYLHAEMPELQKKRISLKPC